MTGESLHICAASGLLKAGSALRITRKVTFLANMNEAAERKRPVGVIILAVCFLIGAIPGLIFAILGGISQSTANSLFDKIIDIPVRILALMSPFIFIATGIGLLKFKIWARWMGMILFPIFSFMFFGVSGIFLDAMLPPNIVSKMIVLGPILLSVFIVYYLTRSKIKAQFG